eukprot:GILK01008504.1.p1 GENE.GILK01008504.1~~GILK01008504.1.p1  ORF type:complete len:299 (+),score=26.79 GILK01008504.1:70-966(+)
MSSACSLSSGSKHEDALERLGAYPLTAGQKMVKQMFSYMQRADSSSLELKKMPINSAMNCLNLYMNVANSKKTQFLYHKYNNLEVAVSRGEKALTELALTVSTHQDSLDGLCEKVSSMEETDHQRELQFAALSSSVTEQKRFLLDSLHKYDKDLEEQHKTLQQQQDVLSRILESRYRQDAITDVIILALSIWAANLRLVSFPVHYISRILAARTRRPQSSPWLAQLIKLGLILSMARYIRDQAQKRGIHHHVGTFTQYSAFISSTAFSLFKHGATDLFRLCSTLRNRYLPLSLPSHKS